jgi:shikimate kinase
MLILSLPVVLIGLMGSGKSTVAAVISKKTGCGFIDSDIEIMQRTGISISDFFQKFGEEKFREKELEVFKEILGNKNSVIAAGGGAFCFEDTREEIKYRAKSFYLKVPPEILAERLQNDDSRPLLKGVDKLQKLKELLAKREEYYLQADFTIEAASMPPYAVADEILSLIN